MMLPLFLSIFTGFLVMWVVTFALPLFFRILERPLQRISSALAADLLFLLELLPCIAAMMAVCFFVLPGFATWEPRHSAESIPWFVVAIAGFALIVFSRSLILALIDLRRTRESAVRGAFIAVLGSIRPQVLVSSEAANVLDGAELECVLEHERAHVTRQDNLRLFISRVLERLVPSAAKLGAMRSERLRYTELAADESAATSADAALLLASALLKVAHISSSQSGLLASAFAATHSESLLTDRVHRLVNFQPKTRLHFELFFDSVAIALPAAFALSLALNAHLQYSFYRLLEIVVQG